MLEVIDLGSSNQVNHKWKQILTDPDSFSLEQIRSLWVMLLSDLNLSRTSHGDLCLAVPGCYDCLTRSVIIDLLTRDYAYKTVKLIPRPLALLGGYIALNPEKILQGDLLCLMPDDKQLDFSFISISDNVICLEQQGVSTWQKIQEETASLINRPGWFIRHLLYADFAHDDILNRPMLETDINIHQIEDPHNTVLLGLKYWSAAGITENNQLMRMIYPYDFYLERTAPQNDQGFREKLSFDLANLELDLSGSYKIASLPPPLFIPES